MDKIFIFTCVNRWVGVSNGIRRRVPTWRQNYPNSGRFIVMCDCNTLKSPASLVPKNDIRAGGVYLLYDDIPTADLDALFQSCQNDKKYILIHTNGNSHGYNFNRWDNCVVRQGMHENFPTQKYYCVFDILTDNEDNKPQRIIDKVFAPILGEVLQFLNGCLVPQNQTTEFRGVRNLLQADLANDVALQKDLEDFMRKYDSSRGLNDYKEELATLRDSLVDYARTH